MNTRSNRFFLIIVLLSSINTLHAGKLHKAAKRGDITKIKQLISEGADVNKKPKLGKLAPLHLAVQNQHYDAVKVLVEAGANIELEGSSLQRPLHLAAQNGNWTITEYLMSKGARVNTVSGSSAPIYKKVRCWIPLQWACEKAHVGVSRLLLSKGTRANIQVSPIGGNNSFTPLILVSIAKKTNKIMRDGEDIECARTLLKFGAVKNKKCTMIISLPNGKVDDLEIYPFTDPKDIKYHLLMAMLTFNREGNKYAQEIMKTVKKKPKKVNKKKHGRSHLLRATDFGLTELVKFLINKGADVNSVDKEKKTALHVASQLGHPEIVQLLLAKKANPNAIDTLRKTPLHNATANCISLLVQAGAKINSQDKNGWTPLHWAVYWADVDRVRELLKAGANPKIKNKRNVTPLWYITKGYKTFVPGSFTKPIIDLLQNPTLAKQDVPTSSAESAPSAPEATATSSAVERPEAAHKTVE